MFGLLLLPILLLLLVGDLPILVVGDLPCQQRDFGHSSHVCVCNRSPFLSVCLSFCLSDCLSVCLDATYVCWFDMGFSAPTVMSLIQWWQSMAKYFTMSLIGYSSIQVFKFKFKFKHCSMSLKMSNLSQRDDASKGACWPGTTLPAPWGSPSPWTGTSSTSRSSGMSATM